MVKKKNARVFRLCVLNRGQVAHCATSFWRALEGFPRRRGGFQGGSGTR